MSLVAALDVMLLQTVTILSSSFMSPSFYSVCSVHPLQYRASLPHLPHLVQLTTLHLRQ